MAADSTAINYVELINSLDIFVIISVLAAIIIPTVVYWRSRASGRLLWWVERIFPLLSDESLIGKRSDIAITYQGEEIDNPWVAIIRFRNSRIRPIKKTDYNSPINIDFGDDAHAVSVSFMDVSENGPVLSGSPRGGNVEIEPVLLNRNEQFSVKVIVSNPANPPTVSGRITDVRIKKRWSPKYFKYLLGGSLLLLGLGTLVIILDSGSDLITLASRVTVLAWGGTVIVLLITLRDYFSE